MLKSHGTGIPWSSGQEIFQATIASTTILNQIFCLLKISKENFSTWCWCQRNSNYLPIHKRVVSVDVASCGHCKHIFSVPFFANKLCTSMMGLATILQSDVKKKLCSQAWSNHLVLQDLLVIFGTWSPNLIAKNLAIHMYMLDNLTP